MTFKALEKLIDLSEPDNPNSGQEKTATIFQDPGRGDIYVRIGDRSICLHPDGSASITRVEWVSIS